MAEQAQQPMALNAHGMPIVPSVTDESGQSRKVQTPAWHQAARDQAAAYQGQEAATQAQAGQNIAAAQQMAPQYQAEVERQAAERSAHLARMAAIQTEIAERSKQHDLRVAKSVEAAEAKPRKLGETLTDDEKSRVRLAIWLGAIGGGLAGRESHAISYLQKQVEGHAQREQQRADRMLKLAEQSRGYLKDAYEQRASELGDYRANVQAGWEHLARLAEGIQKTMLPQQLRAQADGKIALIRQEGAKARMEAQQQIQTEVHSKHSQTVPSNGTGGSTATRTTKDAETYAAALENGRLADRLAELWKDPANRYTAEQLREIKDLENKLMARQEEEHSSVVQSTLGQLGRGLGLLPKSQYPKGMTENQIEGYLLDQRLTHSHLFSEAGTGWTSNPEARQMFTESRVTSPSDRPEIIDAKVRNTISANQEIRQRVQEVSRAGQVEHALGNNPEMANLVAERRGQHAPATARRPTRDEMIAKARAAIKTKAPNAAQARAFLIRQGVRP